MEARQLKSKRHRGCILSEAGRHKLQFQLSQLESQKGYKFTLPVLARRTQLIDSQGLHSTTIKKIVEQQTGVDERSIRTFFQSLELELEPQDYHPADQQQSLVKLVGTNHEPKAIELEPSQSPDFPGGPVPLNSPYYIEQPVLQARACSEISRPGGLIRVKASRKMGKSSFALRLLHHATSLGYHVLQVDLKQADEAVFSSIDRFLRWLFTALSYQLDRPSTLDDYWNEQAGSKVSGTIYLQQVLLKEAAIPIVLVFNEINRVFEYPVIFREFLPLLRSWYEEAKSGSTLQKLRFVLSYSTEIYVPLNLNQSPFNVGLPINLRDLTAEEVQVLANSYGLSSEIVSPLMELVDGHPYLIQLAFYYLWNGQTTLPDLLLKAASPVGIYANHLHQCLSNLQDGAGLAEAFQRVVQADAGVSLELEVARKLESLGLIKFDDDCHAQPSCLLYQQFFGSR
ncbi:serine/threonine protein kinase [filamentous cyanobacterium CCP1]|nr:serine/threonine protein kinase [filamentous cyanobacterium CCP2]PSB63080.1 serine/threonine protein kinase [filamentous cyanobacterium CCP1]